MATIHGFLKESSQLDKSYKLNSPSPTERGETQVLAYINGFIRTLGKPIDIKIGKFTIKNVYGANKIEGTPKADIALVSYDKVSKRFVNSFFLSHKMGTDASGFQQYSGITSKADGSKPGAISADKTVVEFLKSIAGVHSAIVKNKLRFYRVIKDKKLIGKAIYGPNFGDSKFGIDNIHVIAQGNAVMIKSGNVYTLKFSHEAFNPDVAMFQNGDYVAVVGARYSSGRNYEVNGKTYSGARVLIMPKRLIGGQASEI